jgi:hypothetical protein
MSLFTKHESTRDLPSEHKKLRKKDRELLLSINKKVKEILKAPHRFKPLKKHNKSPLRGSITNSAPLSPL